MRRPAARRSTTHSVALAFLLLVLVPTARADPPKIYKWVDANGIAHYTVDPDRIPKALRNRIQSVVRESETLPDEAPSAPEAAAPARAQPGPQLAAPEIHDLARQAKELTPESDLAADEPERVTDEAQDGSDEPDGGAAPPEPVTPGGTDAEPALPPSPTRAAGSPRRAPVHGGADWFERDALPDAPDASVLAGGQASPEQRDALAAQQEALDARIAELQAEVHRDESFLKGLISDPDLDSDVPLFDRPEFLEVSRRLPQLHAQLQELRDERAQLGTP